MVSQRRSVALARPVGCPGRRTTPVRRPKVEAVAGPLAPSRTPETTEEVHDDLDRPWVTIVWNDPVNLMTYVTFVLQELFGYDEPTATTLMLHVHHEGKAIVSSGPRERMEHDTSRLHAYGLWASYQRDS
jgi:ATP-dependent Clp protease adaptor protein ClpS